MKAALLSIVLLALPASVVGQSVCQQLTNQVIEHKSGFSVRSVTLRSAHGVVKATAAIPDSPKPNYATVFSFSTLVGLEPQQFVDVVPLAIDLTKQGWSTMVIERKLTWPDVDASVGTMRADVMCAERWLSRHAKVIPSGWIFVGPDLDAPDPAVGDQPRMTGWLGSLVGDEASIVNTEQLFRSTVELQNWILSQHVDGQ